MAKKGDDGKRPPNPHVPFYDDASEFGTDLPDDPFLARPFNPSAKERGLWVAVILHALTDACGPGKAERDAFAKRDALDWFKTKSKNFTEVCQNAGLEPAWVFEKAQKVIERGQRLPPMYHQADKARAKKTRKGAKNYAYLLPDTDK
jgi:hypothetical protein